MIIKLDGHSRLVIPKLIRKALGIKPDGEIKLEFVDKKIIITKKD